MLPNRTQAPNRDQLKHPLYMIQQSVKTMFETLKDGQNYIAGRLRVNIEKYSSEFLKIWDQLASDTIVISIGSGGSSQQQYPNFAKSDKTSILNIDMNFLNRNSIKEKNDYVDHLPFNLDNDLYPIFFNNLKDFMKKSISSGKHVILISHISPDSIFTMDTLTTLIKDNMNADNFTVIGSYHDGVPVIVYTKAFLQAYFQDQVDKTQLAKLFSELYFVPKKFTEDQLAELTRKYNFDQNIYVNLEQISYEHLKPRFDSNNNNQVSQISDDNNKQTNQTNTQTFWQSSSSEVKTAEEHRPGPVCQKPKSI